MTEKEAEIFNKLEQVEQLLVDVKDLLVVGSFVKPEAPAPQPSIPTPTLSRFPAFEVGSNLSEITGELIEDPIIREVNKRDGSTTQVGNVMLTDGSTTIRVAMWGGLADALNTYQKGERVTITMVNVKAPYDSVTQISSTWSTKISSKN